MELDFEVYMGVGLNMTGSQRNYPLPVPWIRLDLMRGLWLVNSSFHPSIFAIHEPNQGRTVSHRRRQTLQNEWRQSENGLNHMLYHHYQDLNQLWIRCLDWGLTLSFLWLLWETLGHKKISGQPAVANYLSSASLSPIIIILSCPPR